jgi:hypothetical protein
MKIPNETIIEMIPRTSNLEFVPEYIDAVKRLLKRKLKMENTIALEYAFLEFAFRNRRNFINEMKTNSRLINKKKL